MQQTLNCILLVYSSACFKSYHLHVYYLHTRGSLSTLSAPLMCMNSEQHCCGTTRDRLHILYALAAQTEQLIKKTKHNMFTSKSCLCLLWVQLPAETCYCGELSPTSLPQQDGAVALYQLGSWDRQHMLDVCPPIVVQMKCKHSNLCGGHDMYELRVNNVILS